VSAGGRRRPVIALIVFLSICGAILAHYAIVQSSTPTLGALLSLLPLAAVGFVAARRARRRELVLGAIALAALALWLGWGLLEQNFTNLFFIEHAGMNLLLAVMFGRTLVGGSEPLCTRFARIIHGTLPPEVLLYTRRVTLAWAIFFASLFVVSCVLYFGNFVAAWSFLANIASPILIATMFVVEYAIRLRVLPNHERIGILGGMRAFLQHAAARRSAATH
jgi:uncharacterized membrane protein